MSQRWRGKIGKETHKLFNPAPLSRADRQGVRWEGTAPGHHQGEQRGCPVIASQPRAGPAMQSFIRSCALFSTEDKKEIRLFPT